MSERKERGPISRFFLGDGRAKATIDENQWRNSAPITIASYGTGYFAFAKLYRSQPAVRQVISFIAENMGQVPIAVYHRVSDMERERIADHPLATTLNMPNPVLSQFEFQRDLVTDLELFDVSYHQIIRTQGVIALQRLYPDSVTPSKERTVWGTPAGYKVLKSDGTTTELDAAEVLAITGYNGGISPMETLRRILAEDEASGAYREGMYRNGMRNAGVIQRPLEAPDWSDGARQRFMDQLTERHTGESATGRPLLLEEGMEWQSDQISMRSEEYIAGRQFTTRVVANLYRIAPPILGLTDAPYASITAYNSQLYQNALATRMTHVTQSIERQLLDVQERTTGKLYLEFNLDAKLRGSFQEQAAVASLAVGGPFLTVNEQRARLDMPPIEGGDSLASPVDLGGAPNTGAGETDQPSPSEDSLAPKHAKADRGLIRRRDKYAEDIADAVRKTTERVQPKARQKTRWASEVASDIRPEIERVIVAEGVRKATQLGGTFDIKQTQHFIDKVASNVGKSVSSAIEAVQERHPEDRERLNTALNDTASKTGLSLATSMVAFARIEAGKQTGAGTKTWTTTSDDSRHADLDGETVKIGTEFSNGMLYPGDPSADAEETVNCQCVLDIN